MEKIRIIEKTWLTDSKLSNNPGAVLQAEAENYFLVHSRVSQLQRVNGITTCI